MNKKAVEWLYEQLPELVEKGIIPTASVELIRKHYGAGDKNLGGRTMLTMFGIIGVMLVGLGIILILAHNWELLSRMTRTLLTVGMLLVAQILVGATLWFKKDNIVWEECSSTLLMITIGTSMALIGQTYHLADDFSNFLLTWMLLSIPIVYVMGVTTPVLLYLAGVTTWAVSGEFLGLGKQMIWILLAVVGPYYWKLVKRDPYANPSVIISWMLTLCCYISFGTVFAKNLIHLHVLIYATLFGLTYLVGVIWFDNSATIWKKPFKMIGLTGGVGLSFLFTFQDIWRSLGQGFYSIARSEYFLAFVMLVLVLVLAIKVINKKMSKYLLFGAAPIVAALGFLLLYFDNSGITTTVLCNGYILFLSVTVIRKGVQEGNIGILNIGMVMVATLIIMRFFDVNFSFVARGLVFVILGSCFLAANWFMVRRKKEVTK